MVGLAVPSEPIACCHANPGALGTTLPTFEMNDVTRILNSLDKDDPKAAEQLLPLIYEELRKLAASKMSKESPNQTLQPTALVHEAYMRLVDADADKQWDHRGHFFAAASEAMRRILVDNARRKRAMKHGGDLSRTELAESRIVGGRTDDQILLANEALDKLSAVDPVKAEVVKHRFFVGMTNTEVAKVMNLSEATARRHWEYARAWLFAEISDLRQSRRFTR